MSLDMTDTNTMTLTVSERIDDRGGIARIAVFQFLQPVLSVIAAAVILGERVTWTIVAAGLLILAGTWIAQRHAH